MPNQSLHVGVDHPPVDLVLQAVLLDVHPDLHRHLGARQGLAPVMAASWLDGVIGCMNAALGERMAAEAT